MPNFLARSTVACLLAFQLVSSTFAFPHQETRQRRTQSPAEPGKTSPQTASTAWPSPAPTVVTLDPTGAAPSSQPEPTIRVALATDVRSAIVSTNGHLLNASDDGPAPVALDVARVRLEPRLLSPPPVTNNADAFRIQIAGLSARDDLRARSVGLYYLIRSLSITPAAAIGGLLWKISPQVPFVVAGVIGLVGTLVFTLTVEEKYAS